MDTPQLTPEECLKRLQAILDRNTLAGGYTPDGWALKWAIEQLCTAPEQKAISVVIAPIPHVVGDYNMG